MGCSSCGSGGSGSRPRPTQQTGRPRPGTVRIPSRRGR